jgi:hypothetical protein
LALAALGWALEGGDCAALRLRVEHWDLRGELRACGDPCSFHLSDQICRRARVLAASFLQSSKGQISFPSQFPSFFDFESDFTRKSF